MPKSIVYEHSCKLALLIIKLAAKMQKDKEFIISKQLVRSGTSIGANLAEAIFAASKKDFLNKNVVALKEAMETLYWLTLLKDSNEYLLVVDEELTLIQSIINQLVSIVKTIKLRISSNKVHKNSSSINNSVNY